MANLSQQKRQRMMNFLSKLKEEHKDDDSVLIALGEIESELNAKKYGLVWEEHEEAVDVMIKDNIPVFTECTDKEICPLNNGIYNFLLEGDNLHSLKLLEKTHKGRIDVIYIDPPYNTGKNDFIYDDVFIDNDDTFKHSKWISFMYERLKIAYNLLSDSGIIFISINDVEYAQLKMLCDEIFDESNYQVTFHLQVRYADKNVSTEDKTFKPLMEYVLMYSKDSTKFSANQETVDYGLEKFCYKINELTSGTSFNVGSQQVIVFKKGEWEIQKTEGTLEGLKETWITGSIYTTMSYGQVFRTVIEPRIEIDGLGCLYKIIGRGDDGLGYRYYTNPQKKTATKGKMYSGVPLNKAQVFKQGNAPQKKIPIINIFDFSSDFGNIRHEGGIGFNSGKKPIKMISQLLNYSPNKDAIVLDFFAGSGSTGHAVLKQNSVDGGNRRFILCTNNQNNICEQVTYKRLQNVIKDFPANLKYYHTDFVSKNEECLSDALLEHITEMIQLEYSIKLDNKHYIMILNDEEADTLVDHWTEYPDVKALYVSKNVLFTTEQNILFKDVTIHIIPDYYFNFELREAGETW